MPQNKDPSTARELAGAATWAAQKAVLLRRLEASCAPAAAEHDTNTEHHAPGPLPMFTSCCPGWVAMAEKSAPELLPYLSTCKSPHMMLGAVLKGFWASHAGVPARDVEVVSIMPCVRKQGEADRPWFATALNADGSLAAAEGEEGGMVVRDVDHVITTAELGKALVERGVDRRRQHADDGQTFRRSGRRL